MINIELIWPLLSIIIGCSIVLFTHIKKESRTKQIDHWIGIAFFFLLGYKILPLLEFPSNIVKPLTLLMQKSGDLGLVVGFIFAFLYWIKMQIKTKQSRIEAITNIIIALIASYTIFSIIKHEVYLGHHLGIYRAVIGILFLVLIKLKAAFFQMLLMTYSGLLLIIESQSYARIYWGFSLIQWSILFILALYILLKTLDREERKMWQEK